ncbi:motility associated factor glycosyltransferase family protein [Clostridium sp. CF012]|uniref:motility associated factor glycosyltransferase family protein n=1 Tax=Clostridium sp. CF012 TaxID=2843319 RepID=UPI001C0B0620|nr:6-hydroxymethylpterin diphosphokinase MptE-like protein [Clostridium sp. CF012]MBU3142338.1 DUF115 domain-containing protein [Clostridium sp. CF012]
MNEITKSNIAKAENVSIEESFLLEKSKDNRYVVKVSRGTKRCYIGSKYSVENDIDKCISKLTEYDMETTIIIFGVGAGEHILRLINSTCKSNNILVVEPDKNILKLFFESEISQEILSCNRITICLIDEDLKSALYQCLEYDKISNTKFATYANYNELYTDELRFCLEELNNFLTASKLNDFTLTEFSKQYFNNYTKNLKAIVNGYTINTLKDSFKSVPAIIVSAGPSLDKNIGKVKELQDKFIIICGARTLKPLLKNGVKPDFIFIIDPVDTNMKFFENVTEYDVPLVFIGVANYKAVHNHMGKKIYCKNSYTEGYSETLLGKNMDSLFQGGSVAHPCTDLAVYMGCEPVVFIGQDLAYTNGKTHASIANLEDFNIEKDSIKNDIYVKDIYGGMVVTDKPMDYYRKRFEDYIQMKKDTTFINATEGGANIQGTVIMKLEEASMIYGKNIVNKNVDKFLEKESENDVEKVKRELTKILDSYNELKKLCLIGLKHMQQLNKYDIVKQQKQVIKILKKLHEINSKIMNNKEIDFAAAIFLPIFQSTVNNPKYILKDKDSISIMTGKIKESSDEMYSKTLKCLDEVITLIIANTIDL